MSDGARKEGLSPQTLVIASMSSLAAALFIHELWQGGAILGAAVTPVIVALVSEALKKPAEKISTRSVRVRGDTTVRRAEPRPQREDRFGIWEAEEKPSLRDRLSRRHVRIALVTGLIAFAIAAFFLTGAELVLGGGDGDRLTLVPGKQKKDRDRDDPASTQPGETTPAPGEEQEAPESTVTVTQPPPAQTAPPTTPAQPPPSQTGETPPPGEEPSPAVP